MVKIADDHNARAPALHAAIFPDVASPVGPGLSGESLSHPPVVAGRSHVRGARLRERVLDATLRVVEARGIAEARIGEIAELAGVHETSIYRRWKTRPRLLVDALTSRVFEGIAIPDTGSVRADLEGFMYNLAYFAEQGSGAALIKGVLISDADPVVTTVVQEFWHDRLTAVQEIVERGIRRGELPPDTDSHLIIVMLGGLIHFYVGNLASEIPVDLAQRSVSLVLDGALKPS